jgi:hypothetical protein
VGCTYAENRAGKIRVENGYPGVDKFFENYKLEAAMAGFKLDSSGNQDKVQPLDTVVTALGVVFDTVSWTWEAEEVEAG